MLVGAGGWMRKNVKKYVFYNIYDTYINEYVVDSSYTFQFYWCNGGHK